MGEGIADFSQPPNRMEWDGGEEGEVGRGRLMSKKSPCFLL